MGTPSLHETVAGFIGKKGEEKSFTEQAVKGSRLLDFSEIMATGLVKEIDLNPVALYPKGALVLDAKLQAM